jgi:RecJ OB domain
VAVTPVDGVLPRGADLTLELCTELQRLAPFGLGNPDVTLLAAGCELGSLATVGEGKHLRFRVRRDGRDAGGAIAFGLGGQLDRFRQDLRYDVAFRLHENRWNGTVAPQLTVRRIFDADDGFDGLRDWLVAEYRKPAEARHRDAVAIFAELELDVAGLGRRHLLESETFRALLADGPPLAQAA